MPAPAPAADLSGNSGGGAVARVNPRTRDQSPAGSRWLDSSEPSPQPPEVGTWSARLTVRADLDQASPASPASRAPLHLSTWQDAAPASASLPPPGSRRHDPAQGTRPFPFHGSPFLLDALAATFAGGLCHGPWLHASLTSQPSPSARPGTEPDHGPRNLIVVCSPHCHTTSGCHGGPISATPARCTEYESSSAWMTAPSSHARTILQQTIHTTS